MNDVDAFGLTPHQRAIADRVISEESARREHLVLYLSGAHAYGFPSPDSDLDLKAIHVARTGALVGFEPPQPTYDRAGVIEGVEIDYTSNEIAHVLSGILNGNGNYLERVLGRTVLGALPELTELRPLVRAALCRRVYRHYRGFAASQQKRLEEEPTIKRLLYVLRTALTGTHLLRTGELETDVVKLADAYELRDARALVAAKRAGERTAAEPAMLASWRPRLAHVLATLDAARERSVLPEEPRGVPELEAWLIDLRRSRF
ncbi:MAG: nucleotidyltransferase domain-containing protein [Labilithrix sp.]|nr:nucleotidyltransferase domain-containing protein [Labilithrix sp.]MCW5836291.1 nucleotidyltransferase domain-containing protein [Labilithrix sp.]